MGDSFPSRFTNEHEILFYEGMSNQSYPNKNGKSSFILKHQEKENINSPEFSLFHMTSPDLERFIVGQASNTRETTTLNTSDLNVLNLVSPDFEKIFSNINDKDSGYDLNKGRSVQKQHEVYTKTFVDALHKIQGQQLLVNKDCTNIHGASTTQQDNKNYVYQKHQFIKRKGINEQHFISGQDHGVHHNNMNKCLSTYGNFELALMEDKNKNKIGTIGQHSFKDGNIEGITTDDGNRNTINYQISSSSLLETSGVNPHIDNGGFGNLTIPSRNNNLGPSRFTASYSHPNQINPNSGNRNLNVNPSNRPDPSEINLETHPELFKLRAHVKLSENMRDHMEQVPTGHQDVHTSSHMFALPPIDLQVQEVVKRERKKQKNRVAASKCRKKKLEREAQLEVRVQQLRERNVELTTIASALKNQLNDLKQHVMQHIACGCQVTAY